MDFKVGDQVWLNLETGWAEAEILSLDMSVQLDSPVLQAEAKDVPGYDLYYCYPTLDVLARWQIEKFLYDKLSERKIASVNVWSKDAFSAEAIFWFGD